MTARKPTLRTAPVVQSLVFAVEGDPASQGSMRHVGNGRMIHSDKLVAWRQRVALVARNEARRAGWRVTDAPVRMVLRFTMRTPKRAKHRGYASTPPDLDKLIRAICDALKGVVYTDDARVIEISAEKMPGETPAVWIGVHTAGLPRPAAARDDPRRLPRSARDARNGGLGVSVKTKVGELHHGSL